MAAPSPRLDALGRVAVGPESAGSEPGPACYDRGGERPTVTDADVVLGRIDPQQFAGGRIVLDRDKAANALLMEVGKRLDLDDAGAALGVSEMVDENMANASRVHAIESGRTVENRTLIAFGGAAPLHAARLAEKLNVRRVVVPPEAGVGSAIGFLRAPVSYEVTRSFYQRVTSLNVDGANALLDAMRAEALAVVEAGASGRPLSEIRTAFMRYVGQGHEVGVELPVRIHTPRLGPDAPNVLTAAFEDRVPPPVRTQHSVSRSGNSHLGSTGQHRGRSARCGRRIGPSRRCPAVQWSPPHRRYSHR